MDPSLKLPFVCRLVEYQRRTLNSLQSPGNPGAQRQGIKRGHKGKRRKRRNGGKVVGKWWGGRLSSLSDAMKMCTRGQERLACIGAFCNLVWSLLV